MLDKVQARSGVQRKVGAGQPLLEGADGERLWRQPYFRQAPPKSTGRELFNASLLRQVFGSRLLRSPDDVLATVTYFTAYSIAESYRRFVPHRFREVVVSGGGVRNRTLMRHLTRLVAPVPVRSIERYGIPAQAKEPVAFAFLALRALQGRVNHLPSTTGARTPCVLGSITPGGGMSIAVTPHSTLRIPHCS